MANYYMCAVLCLLVLFCGIFDCRNINNRRQNKVNKCDKIENFYGGDVVYFGNREVGSEVFYSCEDDYTQQPEDTESSMCTETGHGTIWVPVPPACLEMAEVEIPRNGFTDAVEDIIEHGQSYNIFCNIGYEFYRGRFYNTDSITITNNNGTLKPKTPRCIPARCDPLSLNETVVSYLNGTEITDMIPSDTKVMYSCIPDYEFRNEDFDVSVIGRCKLGEFRRIPKCIPKRCIIGNIKLNKFSNIKYYREDYSFLYRGFDVSDGSQIEVSCRNDYDYELFVESTQTYVEDFKAECSYGTFDKTDEEFPICLEKRCHFKMSPEYCFWENGTSSDICYHGDFYVPSRMTMNIRCSDGYKLASGTDEDYPTTNCSYGKFSAWTPFDCLPLPCDVPEIGNGKAILNKSVVESLTNVTFQCDDGYHYGEEPYTDTMERMCNLGGWIPGFSHQCEPDSCFIDVKNNTVYTIMESSNNSTSVMSSRLLPHGTVLAVECEESFDMVDENGNSLTQSNETEIATCGFGKWSNVSTFTNVCLKHSIPTGTITAVENVTMSSLSPVTVGEQATQHMSTTTQEPGCMVQDYNRYHYKNAKGKDVASGELIDNGETLNVTCLVVGDEYEFEDYYYSDIKQDTVTCYNGSLSKTDLTCSEDKSGQCLDLENGKVTVTDGYRYHVQCNTGYTLRIDVPVQCDCNDGTLSCFKQVPVCEPDNSQAGTTSAEENVTMSSLSPVTVGEQATQHMSTTTQELGVSTMEATSAEEIVRVSNQSDVFEQTTQSMHFDNSQAGTTSVEENVTMSSLSPVTVGEQATQHMSTTTQELGCIVPGNNRYHYKNAEGKDVASDTMIYNGETLKVTCLIVSGDSDYYDSDIQQDSVTCYNGSLSKTDLECEEDKSGQCLDLENGKVTVTDGYIYHVQCDAGYTLDIYMPEEQCVCKDGTLSCFNQVPICKPDNCLIPLNHDMSIMSVKENGVDMTGGSMVSHASHAVFDCHQHGDDVYEPNNRTYTCKAGKWIKDDRSENLWKYDSNGSFPECIRVARNCTIPRWTNDSKVSVTNADETLLSENVAVQDGEQLDIDCGVTTLPKMHYICKDGLWQQLDKKTFEHVKNGYISNCTVMIGHQGFRLFVESIKSVFNALTEFIYHLVSNTLIETD